MKDEGREHDPLLDAGLEEVLGGHRPPNLSARIAQAWAVRTGQIASGSWTAPAGFVLPPPPNGKALGPQGAPQNGRYAAPIPLTPPRTAPTAPLAEFVGLAPSAGAPLASPVTPAGQPMARPIPIKPAAPVAQTTAPPRGSETPPGGVPTVQSPTVQGRSRATLPGRDEAAWMPWIIAASLLLAASIGGYAVWNAFGPAAKPPIVDQGDGPRGKQPDRPAIAKQPDTPKNPKTPKPGKISPEVLVQGPKPPPSPAVQPLPEPAIVALIDESLSAAWLDHGVEASEPAEDSQWCRRLFLRTLGRIESVQELRAFAADPSPKKRQELADRLLTAPEYTDELARHWSGVWTTVLVGRTPTDPARREGLRAYLEQSLRANKPYDVMVTELVTAAGPADAAGAVNFLLTLAEKDERAVRTTSRTTQVLLGVQLECARCHEHPFQKTGPDQYWAMNGFFRQMEVRSQGDVRELANIDFAGDKPAAGEPMGDGAVRYLDPAGKEQVAFPRVLGGEELAKSGRLAEVDRRGELAKQIVHSPNLSRTLINRLWAHYFGVGFVPPTEQLSPRAKASHPELLDQLSGQFAAHGHDLRKAMRWIVSSQAFSLSTKPRDHNNTRDEPLAGTMPLFSRYYVRPSTSERIDQSLMNLADAAKTGRSIADEKGRMVWLARPGPDSPRAALSIEGPPSGAPIGQAVDLSEGGLLDRLAFSKKLSTADKISHLFLAALDREPTARERGAAQEVFAARKDDTIAALQDLWWALLHSNEFNQGL